MGIISLFRADVDSRIEKRLTALESAIADLPAKISAAEKKVIWDLFEKDFDAIAKGSNATVREIRDLPEKFAAYAKIYLKAALKEIDPEAVAAELDEAQGILTAFSENCRSLIAPVGWIRAADFAEEFDLNDRTKNSIAYVASKYKVPKQYFVVGVPTNLMHYQKDALVDAFVKQGIPEYPDEKEEDSE